MDCWKCNKTISEDPIQIGFRAVCRHCDVDLHVCKNCRYFYPGKPNDCLVPGTDFVRDREASNLCEEFKLKIALQNPNFTKLERKIFNDDDLPQKKDFKDLFKDS